MVALKAVGFRARCFFVSLCAPSRVVAKVTREITNMRRDMRLLRREAVEIVPLQFGPIATPGETTASLCTMSSNIAATPNTSPALYIRSPSPVRVSSLPQAMKQRHRSAREHPASSSTPYPRDAGRSCAIPLTEASADRPLGTRSNPDFSAAGAWLTTHDSPLSGPAHKICALPIKKDSRRKNPCL
jgi:hypothetical protein